MHVVSAYVVPGAGLTAHSSAFGVERIVCKNNVSTSQTLAPSVCHLAWMLVRNGGAQSHESFTEQEVFLPKLAPLPT